MPPQDPHPSISCTFVSLSKCLLNVICASTTTIGNVSMHLPLSVQIPCLHDGFLSFLQCTSTGSGHELKQALGDGLRSSCNRWPPACFGDADNYNIYLRALNNYCLPKIIQIDRQGQLRPFSQCPLHRAIDHDGLDLVGVPHCPLADS